MKLNFKQIEVEVMFGEFMTIDISKEVGNYIHANTPDIGLDDVAREIYYSEGEVEVSGEYAQAIKMIVEEARCPLVASVKRAILKQLKQ